MNQKIKIIKIYKIKLPKIQKLKKEEKVLHFKFKIDLTNLLFQILY